MAAVATRILIVEDDRGIGEWLQQMLCEEGFDARWALPDDAIPIGLAFAPQCTLVDLCMRPTDGVAVADAFQQHPKLAAVPIVLTSAWPDLDAAAMRARVYRALRKPYDIDDLFAVIKEAVEHGYNSTLGP